VAGNQNSTPVEGQLRETLELLAERHGLPMPQAASPPWLPHGHTLSHIEACHFDRLKNELTLLSYAQALNACYDLVGKLEHSTRQHLGS
jgi:hypothetical protein